MSAPQAAQSLPLPVVQPAKTVCRARGPLPVFIAKPVLGIIGDRARRAWRYLAREPAAGPGIMQRLLAPNGRIWHSWLIGAPVKRAP